MIYSNQDWQPIETAPKDGTYILVANDAADKAWIARWAPIAVSGYRFDEPWRSMMLNHYHIAEQARYLPPTLWKSLDVAQLGQQGRVQAAKTAGSDDKRAALTESILALGTVEQTAPVIGLLVAYIESLARSE